uniref:SRCR domain-containing protein n=1 Tax=Sphaeramia orbicularis TaxID=375764 RepID=A0A672Z2Z6_9TELE
MSYICILTFNSSMWSRWCVVVLNWTLTGLSYFYTESVHFRLVGGASRCHGDLEMKRQDGNWKPVNGEDCLLPSVSTDSVRLVHGSSVCSGRLEVRSNQSGSWSSVCEGHLDLHGAQVVCRELGCGAPGLLQGALYGAAEAPVVQTFQCEGHESALLDCGSSGSQTCSSGTDVDLTCTDPDDVRLVGGATRCNGEVEIKHHGEWRYMQYYFRTDPWILKAADVICRQLDCGSAVSVRRGSFAPFWSISPYCLLSTSILRDCVKIDTSSSGPPLFLTCSGKSTDDGPDSVRVLP